MYEPSSSLAHFEAPAAMSSCIVLSSTRARAQILPLSVQCAARANVASQAWPARRLRARTRRFAPAVGCRRWFDHERCSIALPDRVVPSMGTRTPLTRLLLQRRMRTEPPNSASTASAALSRLNNIAPRGLFIA